MKTLIVGTTYLNSEAKCSLLRIWASLIERNSPECDVLVIDSASPTPAASVLPARYATGASRKIHRFDDDIGHPIDSSDPSRDFLFGLDYADRHGYDYVVHWETDCLMARSANDIVRKIHAANVNVAAPFDANLQFIETQLLFMHVNAMSNSRFIERYRAEYNPKEEFSERCVERLVGDDLFILPLRGMRNNYGAVTPNNIKEAFRYGCDYISHCDDFQVYIEFLGMNT